LKLLCILQASRFDVTNFDKDFTSKEPSLTPTDSAVIKAINQQEFVGFSFVNDDYKRPDIAKAAVMREPPKSPDDITTTTPSVTGDVAVT